MILSSLYAKLAAVLLGLFLAVGTILVMVSVYATDMYEQEVNQKLNYDIARLIVAEKIIVENNKINEEALEEIFHMLMVINPGIEVYLLDPDGNILAYSAEPGKVKRARVDLEPIMMFLKGKSAYPIVGDDPRNSDKRKAFSAARIPEEGPLQGYIYVILGGEAYDSIAEKIQRSYILQLTMWAIIACVSVALITGLILFASLTRRLRRLSAAMDAYKDGASHAALDLPGGEPNQGDEINRLMATFRQMAKRIQDQVESMRNSDLMRRELVASVSHDLRTPLTTLRGYIETLKMKDSTLTDQERRHYLDIVIKHCTRLGKLVTDLFELAKLESGDVRVNRETFDLRELVQDVLQKFALVAKDKGVSISTNLTRELPHAHADIALIERVLENLLDNALRFTSEGGKIGVELHEHQKGVAVEVSDTGPGIPEEQIARIFDRFYHQPRGEERSDNHAGLGLAITKRILELHGTSVNVRSILNKGTTFFFTLPAQE